MTSFASPSRGSTSYVSWGPGRLMKPRVAVFIPTLSKLAGWSPVTPVTRGRAMVKVSLPASGGPP